MADSPHGEGGNGGGDTHAAVRNDHGFDGKDVAGAQDLPRMVGSTPIGKEVSLGTIREGRRRDVKVTIRGFRDQALTS